jgi:hypothetical protein
MNLLSIFGPDPDSNFMINAGREAREGKRGKGSAGREAREGKRGKRVEGAEGEVTWVDGRMTAWMSGSRLWPRSQW